MLPRTQRFPGMAAMPNKQPRQLDRGAQQAVPAAIPVPLLQGMHLTQVESPCHHS